MLQTILTPEYCRQYAQVWPQRTLTDVLKQQLDRRPDKVAMTDRNGSLTYREFSHTVDRVAQALIAHGVGSADVVSFQLPNWNEFLILHYAATRIGAISNPLIPIYRDREIGYMVKQAGAKVLIIPDEFRGYRYTDMVTRLRGEWPALQHVFVIGDNVPAGMEPFRKLTDEAWESRPGAVLLDEIAVNPDDVTELIFTSGTTGLPKGVMHTHNSLGTTNDIMIERLHLGADDVIFMASTFAHQTGFLYGVRMPVELGATAIFQDIWNAGQLAESIERDRVTFTMGATPFLYDLVQFEGLSHFDLASLRYFVSAGAPIPRPLVREAYQKLTCKILSGWGQSEDGLVTVTMPDDPIDKLVNTDGVPFSVLAVKTLALDGSVCQANEEGDLWVRGPSLFVGYWQNVEETMHQFDGDWFKTGDRATIDEDGYIRITGRARDMVIRGGENIPVAYVENVMHEHPGVAVAQIVAMPDARLQERACAFVSMKPGHEPLTLDALKSFLTDKGVARQYWPERLEVLTEFPRTASGKIQKYRLREQVAMLLHQEAAESG